MVRKIAVRQIPLFFSHFPVFSSSFRASGFCLWLATTFVTTAGVAASTFAEEPIEFNLLRLKSSQEARQTLHAPARFLWDQQALRDAVAGVGNAYSLTFWIDRRVDPTQPITYSPQSEVADSAIWSKNSLGARLEQALATLNIEVSLMENLLVIGRKEDGADLQAAAVRLHEAIHRLDPKLAAESRPLQWSELTTPQQLVDQIAKQWGIVVQGELPHDLMHAGKLHQPATLATQLTLICGGFRKEVVAVAPRTLVIQPITVEPSWVSVYPRSQLSLDRLSAIRKAFPGGSVRTRNDLSTVQGVTNFHLALQATVPAARKGPASERATWTFQIANAPAQAIMDNLASGTNLEIVWDPSCTEEHKMQLINLQVDNATLEELLQQVCDAAGLSFSRQGKEVTLRPK